MLRVRAPVDSTEKHAPLPLHTQFLVGDSFTLVPHSAHGLVTAHWQPDPHRSLIDRTLLVCRLPCCPSGMPAIQAKIGWRASIVGSGALHLHFWQRHFGAPHQERSSAALKAHVFWPAMPPTADKHGRLPIVGASIFKHFRASSWVGSACSTVPWACFSGRRRRHHGDLYHRDDLSIFWCPLCRVVYTELAVQARVQVVCMHLQPSSRTDMEETQTLRVFPFAL